MGAQFAKAGDVELCFEAFGDGAEEPLLLIAGLGAQMLSWDANFCGLLASEGFWVIRFDNRDSGLSTHMDTAADLAAVMAGDHSSASYSLEQLADDAAALLTALDVRSAHVVGASMGGMIAQLLAIRHPTRVRSLASVMSTTGNPSVGYPSAQALQALLAQPADSTDEALIELNTMRARAWESPKYPRSDAQVRGFAEELNKRRIGEGGSTRQLAAILSAEDRTAGLRKVNVPALVIHGADDNLVNVSGGEATAAALPDSQLLVFPGVGHDLPYSLWPDLVAAIAANARRA